MVLVGDDFVLYMYVWMKWNWLVKVGMESWYVEFLVVIMIFRFVVEIEVLLVDFVVDGILLQYLVFVYIDECVVFEVIVLSKDVDGVIMYSFAVMVFDELGFYFCMFGGIVWFFDVYDVELLGKCVVVVGCSFILGKFVGMFLFSRDVIVMYCYFCMKDLVV